MPWDSPGCSLTTTYTHLRHCCLERTMTLRVFMKIRMYPPSLAYGAGPYLRRSLTRTFLQSSVDWARPANPCFTSRLLCRHRTPIVCHLSAIRSLTPGTARNQHLRVSIPFCNSPHSRFPRIDGELPTSWTGVVPLRATRSTEFRLTIALYGKAPLTSARSAIL